MIWIYNCYNKTVDLSNWLGILINTKLKSRSETENIYSVELKEVPSRSNWKRNMIVFVIFLGVYEEIIILKSNKNYPLQENSNHPPVIR